MTTALIAGTTNTTRYMKTIEELKQLKGLVATICTSGLVDDLYAASHEEMRSYNDRNGWHAVEYRKIGAALVEAGRDEAVSHALGNGYDWLLHIDADAAPFRADAVSYLLHLAYNAIPDADAIGGYCILKGSHLPTIDTGTGTWEEHYPGEGVLPVIRTGAHFLFTKTSLYRRFGPPWFRTRLVKRPIDAFAEVDNFMRCHHDGKNVFTGAEWDRAIAAAKTGSTGGQSVVGEDSGLCDAAVFSGARLFVDTDLVIGHVSKHILGPDDLRKRIERDDTVRRLACGVMS